MAGGGGGVSGFSPWRWSFSRIEGGGWFLSDQVGPGNISVVSPPAPHPNGGAAHFGAAGHQQYPDAPPEYSPEEDDDEGAFGDRAVRRGEPRGTRGGRRADLGGSGNALKRLPPPTSRLHQESLPDPDAPAAAHRGHHLRLRLLVRGPRRRARDSPPNASENQILIGTRAAGRRFLNLLPLMAFISLAPTPCPLLIFNKKHSTASVKRIELLLNAPPPPSVFLLSNNRDTLRDWTREHYWFTYCTM